MTDDLRLYVLDGCGYCEDVRAVARRLGLELREVDIREDAAAARELVEARGRRTVPVLRIGEATWLGESLDIIDYLNERFGDGKKPGWWARSRSPYDTIAMWGLLLAGGVMADPWQSALWTGACLLAAFRSFGCASRTGRWVHWAVSGAFLFGAISIVLSALDVVDLPWWYAAFGVAAIALGGALVQGFRGRGESVCEAPSE